MYIVIVGARGIGQRLTEIALKDGRHNVIVIDKDHSLIVSGTGDVVEPDDGITAIGSGGSYALAAARALVNHSDLDAKTIVEEALKIASEICIYTNDNIVLEEL